MCVCVCVREREGERERGDCVFRVYLLLHVCSKINYFFSLFYFAYDDDSYMYGSLIKLGL